ncbi:hypothetical protein V2G26_001359 [Clonostachys chloroleuca]
MCVRRLAWVADLWGLDRCSRLRSDVSPRRPGGKVGGLNQGSPYSFEQSVKNNGDEQPASGTKAGEAEVRGLPPLFVHGQAQGVGCKRNTSQKEGAVSPE